MFPLSDSARASRFPFFTILLILANVFVFIKEITAPDPDNFILHYALIPSHVQFNDYHTFLPFVTAIFLHGGFLHILSNMWFLWIFGDNVEGELSPVGFILLFLGAGIAGNILQFLIMPGSTIPLLGASGAVAGILGCYYVLFPQSRVRTLIFLFFFVTIIEVSAPLVLGYWFVLQIISGATSLNQMASAQGGVAFFAHIAGFIFGVIVGRMLNANNKSLYE
ncbi:MAG: rhomboid family intramembrane serine protease [Candidatus Levyibacteriota bacterium]